MTASDTPRRVAILGASGYTGAELTRLLVRHPRARIVALTGERKAGQAIGSVFPHLALAAERDRLPDLTTIDDVDLDAIDVAFFALPHGAAHPVAAAMPASVKMIDLSPDFRFADPAVYGEWYGQAHGAPALQAQAVYGLSEVNREAIRRARLVGCPGCYPTASLLPLVPLAASGLIDVDDIIIDAKSGVSGAGRAANSLRIVSSWAVGPRSAR